MLRLPGERRKRNLPCCIARWRKIMFKAKKQKRGWMAMRESMYLMRCFTHSWRAKCLWRGKVKSARPDGSSEGNDIDHRPSVVYSERGGPIAGQGRGW